MAEDKKPFNAWVPAAAILYVLLEWVEKPNRYLFIAAALVFVFLLVRHFGAKFMATTWQARSTRQIFFVINDFVATAAVGVAMCYGLSGRLTSFNVTLVGVAMLISAVANVLLYRHHDLPTK